MEIKIEKLKPNKYNPREIFRGAAMEELKASIADSGLIHPILVRPIGNSTYEVVAGMRRYYAMKDLGYETIECHVRKLTDFEAILLAYTENIQRENLTPIETGRMYRNLMDNLPSNGNKNLKDFQISDSQKIGKISKQMKISTRSVRNYISLLDLPKGLQDLIEVNFHDNKSGLPTYYGFELARLSKLGDKVMMDFYESYYADPDLRLSIENFKKKINEKLDESKLKDKAKKEQLEIKAKKIEMEIEKLLSSKEKYEQKINDAIEEIRKQYNQEITSESAIEFLEQEIAKEVSTESIDIIAKQMRELQNQIDDLDVLVERTKSENIRSCPYCLAKIDMPIIEKRKDVFATEIEKYELELKQYNLRKSLNTKFKKDLEDNKEMFEKKVKDLEQKQKELEEIENELK